MRLTICVHSTPTRLSQLMYAVLVISIPLPTPLRLIGKVTNISPTINYETVDIRSGVG